MQNVITSGDFLLSIHHENLVCWKQVHTCMLNTHDQFLITYFTINQNFLLCFSLLVQFRIFWLLLLQWVQNKHCRSGGLFVGCAEPASSCPTKRFWPDLPSFVCKLTLLRTLFFVKGMEGWTKHFTKYLSLHIPSLSLLLCSLSVLHFLSLSDYYNINSHVLQNWNEVEEGTQ